MKKILVFIFAFMFLISFASAATFDNRLRSYDENTETIIIDDNFGLGGDLVKVQLLSNTYTCLTDCEAIWNVTIYKDDDNFLTDLVFEMQNIESHEFQLLTGYSSVTVNDYGEDCSRKDSLGICSMNIIGTHEEQVENWITFDPRRKLPIGNFIVKFKGKKNWDVSTDWIASFYGKEIRQWAFWASTAPTTVWEFNDGAGARITNDTLGLNNLTTNISNGNFTAGKLNNAWNSPDTSGAITLNASGASEFAFGLGDFTIAFWLNSTVTASAFIPINTNEGAAGWGVNTDTGFTNMTFVSGGAVRARTQQKINDGDWKRLVFVRSGTGAGEFKVYENGTNYANFTNADDISDDSTALIFLAPNNVGNISYDSFQIYKGFAWSAEDVAFDYNNGTGREANDTGIAPIVITLNTPDDNAVFTASPIGILFNATISHNNTITNTSLYFDGAVNFSINPATNFTELIANVTFTNGVHTWFVEAVNDAGASTNSTVRSFTVDAILPNITVIFPTNGTNVLTLNPTVNVSFNVTVTDNTALGSCFFFNSTANITLSCPNNASVVLGPGFHTLIYYANDTAGNLQQNITTLFVNAINETFFFIDPIIENTLQDINFILTATNIDTFSGSIFYNNTGFVPSSVSFNSTQANITTRVNSTQVNTVTNIPIFANYTVNSANFTSQQVNQSVLFIDIDACTTFTNRILNFTVVDEKEQTFIPDATIEAAVNIFDPSRTNLLLNVSNNYTNPVAICLNINLTGDARFSLDSVVRYEKPLEYANEYFNIINFSLTNNSDPQDITLFDLNISDSTPFKIVFTDQFLNPLTDVLVFIERQYISEDVFKVVELPLTDSNGETIGHFVRNEVLYNLKFIKDGNLIVQFLNIRTFCEDFSIGECELILSSTGESSLTPTFNTLFGVTFESPIFNATTETVRFDFTSVDGTAKNMIMNVSRNDVFGNRTLCSDTLTSSGGSLICTVGNISDTLLIVEVSSNSEPILLSSLQINRAGGYGDIGYIVWFVFILVYLLAFADTKTGVLIGLGLSYIGAIVMGITDGTIVGVASGGIWVIVITLIGIWKINKENPQ